MYRIVRLSIFILAIVSLHSGYAQLHYKNPDSVTVVAGERYERSKLFQFFWGSNWREEWVVPIRVPIVLLDTVYGGVIPYEKGGGNETNTLRLRTSAGKEYAIRSIDKSRKDVTPRLLRNTFIGKIIQDGVVMSYPYAAIAITGMLEGADIYHTKPKLVYIPEQGRLDTFNDVFANDLYILEERPDGDWSDVSHLGNFKKFYSTVDVIKKLQQDHLYKADQNAYIKARLFDILISDWDKHHDNWKWGMQEDHKLFKPIPRDRDQALFTRNGLLNNLIISLSGLKFMQQFGHKINSINALTSQDRKLDRIFTNAMVLQDWLNAAHYLQEVLTDSVIEHSVLQLPPQVFAISGREIINKLKSRRNDLVVYAKEFYSVLSKQVQVIGSAKNEMFEVRRIKGQTLIEVYGIHKNGNKETYPFYKRVFSDDETRLIIINGLGGEDVFNISSEVENVKVVT